MSLISAFKNVVGTIGAVATGAGKIYSEVQLIKNEIKTHNSDAAGNKFAKEVAVISSGATVPDYLQIGAAFKIAFALSWDLLKAVVTKIKE